MSEKDRNLPFALYVFMLEFTRLKNNLKNNTGDFATIRLAVLCDFASQHLSIALRGYGVDRKIAIEIYEADYDQIAQQVFDETSMLYTSSPEFVLLSKSSYKLLDAFYTMPIEERNRFAETTCLHLQTLIETLQQRA